MLYADVSVDDISPRKNLDGYFKGYTLSDVSPKAFSSYIETRKQEGAMPATVNRELLSSVKGLQSCFETVGMV